jgi:hypothetical protein
MNGIALASVPPTVPRSETPDAFVVGCSLGNHAMLRQ